MLEKIPLEYIIYNIWDTMSMIELDNKTKDLESSIGALCGISSFAIFNSGPKKIIDVVHYFYLENGRVLGTKPPVADDDNLLELKNWIVILDSSYLKDNRNDILAENEQLTTNVNAHIFDMDAISSYPSNTTAANVSKDTTSREILKVENMDFEDLRKENINLFFGEVNSSNYCENVLWMPSLRHLSNLIKKNR